MHTPPTRPRVAVVGRGRLGSALVPALRDAGWTVDGPLGRDTAPEGADVVFLCVPDREIATAAAALAPRAGVLVGHCSGATPLTALAPHESFGLHPLMTIPAGAPTRFDGATAGVAGTTAHALATAQDLAASLGMLPFTLDDGARPAYHAAASVASNYLLTVEDLAERLAAVAGVPRQALVPLVRATVDNWAAHGAARVLTGPIARSDTATVARQRAAVDAMSPADLDLFDTLAAATGRLAGRGAA